MGIHSYARNDTQLAKLMVTNQILFAYYSAMCTCIS